MIRADLRLARSRWIRAVQDRRERRQRRQSDFLRVVVDGKTTDFHSLRVSYITALVKSGASVKECQTLARHSNPALTLNTYTRLGVHDLSGALERLPSLSDDSEIEQAAALREGTNNAPLPPRQYPHQLRREIVRNDANRCETRIGKADRHASIVDAATPDGNETSRDDAKSCETVRRGGDSNPRCRFIPARRFSKPLP